MKVEYSFVPKHFLECTHGWALTTQGTDLTPGTRLKFQNVSPIIVQPSEGTKVPLGLFIQKTSGFPLILNAICANSLIAGHTGLIDPGYRGEVSVILATASKSTVEIAPGHLTVYILPVSYTVPVITDDHLLKNPVYDEDAGFDFRASEDLCLLPKTRHTFQFDLTHLSGIAPEFTPVVLGRSGIACRGILVTPTGINMAEKFSLTLHNLTTEPIIIPQGIRIAQIVFVSKSYSPSLLQLLANKETVMDIPDLTAVQFIRVPHESAQKAENVQEKNRRYSRQRPAKPSREGRGFGSSGVN
ncbi:deoxyuridine triphosphatase [Wood mouse herpesvirus]|uniref:Deoxyuridine triphosphatase n=1 Tax=Wood mouse herpesvirus TaxID=432370 RepID=D0U1P3_9GAMA|nr:deoxyuridine triphosphatase [Wood mouse herpesvirus]ACY41124.1 deoxyuridine triphosphatase [Wood mouse herpesvirus]